MFMASWVFRRMDWSHCQQRRASSAALTSRARRWRSPNVRWTNSWQRGQFLSQTASRNGSAVFAGVAQLTNAPVWILVRRKPRAAKFARGRWPRRQCDVGVGVIEIVGGRAGRNSRDPDTSGFPGRQDAVGCAENEVAVGRSSCYSDADAN